LLKDKVENNLFNEAEIVKQISPTAWRHINFMGRYEFNQQKEEINIPEIIKEIKSITLIPSDIPY
jgi:hypothetical protein